jgi:chitodextrinase
VKKLVFLFALLLVGVAAAAPSVVSTTETSATVEGLDCGSKYRFEIRKYNADGSLSSTTSSVDAQTKSCPDTLPPSAPQNVAATGATQTSISISWSASTDDVGVTGYDVYRNGAKIDSTNATSYTFAGLSCGASYVLAVEAHDATGKRSAASAITDSTTACPPPSCPTGEYGTQYYGNMTLSGTPVLQRCETAINSDWGSGSPASVPADRFSTRWTGTHSFSAGTYQFTATADDGIRVWIDGVPLIDAWKDQGPTTYQAARILSAGEHVVKVEYYENGGGAVAKVSWQLNPPTPPPPPPPPPATSCPTGQYSAQYYGNMTLSGTPVLQRCESAINHGWGSGSPATGVPADRFSTRWTGTHSFAAGTYDFAATADDGIRVWIDGVPLIDAWKDQGPTTYPAARILTAGEHVVKVEYYENAGGAVARVSWQVSQPTLPPPPPPPSPSPGVVLQPGQSWNTAYQQAQCGDTIGLAAGTHPSQTIVEKTGLNACANPVTFQPVQGAAVTVSGRIFLGSAGGYATNGPANLVLRGFSYTDSIQIWSDARNILVDGVNGGGFLVQGANGVTVRDSDFGPCNSSPPGQCERVFILDGRGAGESPTTDILFENNRIHDFVISAPGDHHECMFTTGGTNVTIRGNRFWNCHTYAIATGGRSYSDYDNWIIENNWFGRTCCFGTSDRGSAIVMGGPVPVSDTLIRFNSFGPGQAVVTEGASVGGNVRVLGNILGAKSCVPGISYSYNLTLGGGCSSTDRTVAQLPYVNPSVLGDGDYHLVPGSAAEAFVTSTGADSSLAVDKDGSPRSVPRDAGSDER